MASNHLGADATACVEVPDRELVPGVDGDEAVGAELDMLERRRPRRFEDLLHAPLSKNVGLASPELGLTGPYRQK